MSWTQASGSLASCSRFSAVDDAGVHQGGGAAGKGRWAWVRALGNGLFFHGRGFLGHVRKLERGRRAVKRNPGRSV